MKPSSKGNSEVEARRAFVMRAARAVGPLSVGLALVLVGSGCGGGKSAPAAQTTTRSSSARVAISAPSPHLSILSPRKGASTGSTLTVRVAVDNAPAGGKHRFRYVLDRRLTRSGSSHLTFRDLAPGRHHLVVLMTKSTARASTTFTVRAPARPVAAQAPPVEVQSTTSAPAPAAPAPAEATPPPAEATPPPPSTPSPQAGGIPQGPNAGDGDSDNHGAPSDGDGNI